MISFNYLLDLCERARQSVLDSSNTKTILVAAAAFLYASYLIAGWREKKRYFKRLNVPAPEPKFLLGNFLDVGKLGLHKYDEAMTTNYGQTFGYFEVSRPIIVTIDPKFIKAFMVKDFSSFVNRRVFEGLFIDPIDKSLLNLKDDEWRNTRMVVATSFTSGKLKGMAKLISKYAKQSCKHLEKRAIEEQPFNVFELFQAFVLDMGTSCLFGLETDSLGDPESVLLKHMKKVGSFSISLKIIFLVLFPTISKFLANNNIVHFMPKDSLDYLQRVVEEIINRRKNHKERREDFIQNMLDHADEIDQSSETEPKAKVTKRKLTSKEILSQAVLLLGGGGDTAVITLTFMAYQLAMNPDVQERLCQEVDALMEKNKGEIDYDAISELKYMDMVMSETLRMYPPTLRLDRLCNSDNYRYNDMIIPRDSVCAISIWALHHNPQFYPDPEHFDPERFSPGESKQRDATFEGYTYLPFGTGPRGCVGMRFALIKMKLLMAEILSQYNFAKCEKTPERVEINGSTGFCKPKVPIFLKLVKRTKHE